MCSAATRFQGGPGDAVLLEVCQVGNLVDEDVGALGEGDEIVVHGGIPREHDRAVDGVETIGQRWNSSAMCHGDGGCTRTASSSKTTTGTWTNP